MTSQPDSESRKSTERRFELFTFLRSGARDNPEESRPPGKINRVEAPQEDDLRLVIGNSRTRTLPFHGVFEWIKFDT